MVLTDPEASGLVTFCCVLSRRTGDCSIDKPHRTAVPVAGLRRAYLSAV